MKAVLMTAPGNPEVLQLREIANPLPPQNTELLVRLKAAGVNPIDTKLRKRGTFYPDKMPAILGCDGAGIVEAIGNSVKRFRVGDEVYFCSGGIGDRQGNYAEFHNSRRALRSCETEINLFYRSCCRTFSIDYSLGSLIRTRTFRTR